MVAKQPLDHHNLYKVEDLYCAIQAILTLMQVVWPARTDLQDTMALSNLSAVASPRWSLLTAPVRTAANQFKAYKA